MAPRVLFVVICAAIGIVACDKSGPSPAPAPSTLPDQSAVTSSGGSADSPLLAAQAPPGKLEQRVNMHDACDGATFNAVLGDGACIRNGGVKFDQFIAMLTQHGVAGPWNFAPNNLSGHAGETLVAFNQGGEEHTFTEVEEFGGGIVPPLNDLSHNPTVAPECAALVPGSDDFVAPGEIYREEEPLEAGTTARFQCCIHPWMRLEVQVSH